MSKHILALFSLFVLLSGSISAQTPVWLSHYGNGGNSSSNGFFLVPDQNGNLYGSGRIGGAAMDFDGHEVTVLGEKDALLVKWDADGHALWAHTSGGPQGAPGVEIDGGSWVAYDAQNDRVVQVGAYGTNATFGPFMLPNPNGQQGGFVAAYSAAGDCLWVKGIRAPGVGARGILIDTASNIFVFGNGYSPITFLGTTVSLLTGGFGAKYASDGELIAAQRVVVGGEIHGAAWADPEHWVLGGQLMPGATVYGQPVPSLSPDGTGFLAHTDTAGTVQWVATFPSDSISNIFEAVVDGTGRTLLYGYFFNDLMLPNDTLLGVPGQQTYFIAALAADGTVVWAHAINSADNPTGQIFITGLSVAASGDVYACGVFHDIITMQNIPLSAATTSDEFILRLHADGSVVAFRNFGRIRTTRSIIANDAGVFLAGTYDSTLVIGSTSVPNSLIPPYAGYPDFFITKFDSISGVTGVQSLALVDAGLHIYANPNNGLCTIDLPASLRRTNDLVLTIYDNTGQVVQQVPLNFSTEGVRVDIRAQAKGIYHVELGDGTQRYAGTIVFE